MYTNFIEMPHKKTGYICFATEATFTRTNIQQCKKYIEMLMMTCKFLFCHLPGLEPLNSWKSKEMEKYAKKNSLKQNPTNMESMRGHYKIAW